MGGFSKPPSPRSTLPNNEQHKPRSNSAIYVGNPNLHGSRDRKANDATWKLNNGSKHTNLEWHIMIQTQAQQHKTTGERAFGSPARRIDPSQKELSCIHALQKRQTMRCKQTTRQWSNQYKSTIYKGSQKSRKEIDIADITMLSTSWGEAQPSKILIKEKP